MLEQINVEAHLRERSTSVETVGDEQRFSHPTGCSSILVRRGANTPLPAFLDASPLRTFYELYAGASIGDSDLMFATPVEGGIAVSHGYTLPDFARVRSVAQTYSIQNSSEEILFLVTYGWMFFYGYVGAELRVHDRDFGTCDKATFQEVLRNWWQIANDNRN